MGSKKAFMGFAIGDLAARAGCRVETVRYYEREGLMPDPPRSPGGQRVYDAEHMKQLTFIRRARELGFTIGQVRGLLALSDSGDSTCVDVKAMTLGHRDDVQRKIADLERLDAALADLVERCEGGRSRECGILEALFGADCT